MRTDTVDSQALFEFLLRMGDNCLILGHRASEWCGHAPVLEEDIALANVALDLIGQTQLWLGLAADVENAGRTADELAYRRDAFDFRNVLLVELPNGDFGRTLMRHFLFDAWHLPTLETLRESADTRVADIAGKAAKEVAYHLDRSADLVIRLGDGTSESHQRVQQALNDLWPYAGELLEPDESLAVLESQGILPDAQLVAARWHDKVSAVLERGTLARPENPYVQRGGRRGVHSEHLGYILAEMQFLQRAYPDASW